MATKKAKTLKKSTSIEKPKTKVAAIVTPAAKQNKIATKYTACCKALKEKPVIAAAIAEFIGTFLLTTAFLEMQSSPLFIAFSLMGVVFIVGGVSGAHINPAMTIGAWITGKVKSLTAVCYVAAQLLGAGAAWMILNAFANAAENTSSLSTTTLFHAATITSGDEWFLFFAELLGATIIALGVAKAIQLVRCSRVAAAMTAGLATLIALYVAMSLSTLLLTESYTGYTFLNPAIAFAANAFAWDIWSIAIFILAPVLGGVIGFAVQGFFETQVEECECTVCKK